MSYALKGLQRCWLPIDGRWSHIYHLDGREEANELLPQSDVFYTLNVLLGLSRVKDVPNNINVPAIFERNASQLQTLPVSKYAFGMAMWAAAELNLDLPFDVAGSLENLLSDESNWWNFRAQDLGMILTGIVAQARADRKELYRFADPLFAFLTQHFYNASGLFCDAPAGLRRRFGSFASQTYLAIACYYFGEFTNNRRALEIAHACVRRLIELQGPRGEWPWLFDTKRGRILRFL